MGLSEQWFTERYAEFGTGFSLQIRACLHEERTPICHIAIYDTTHFGKLMAIDNVIMLTSRDNFLYHEMLSHPALFSHPHPLDIVIIGGGDGGTLKEVLKHPIRTVKQIEIEKRVTELAQEYFPELWPYPDDPRATLFFTDGIRWMAQAPAQSADIIIVDSTDPIGPAEGLFNETFYRACHRVLREDGLLVHQSESPLIHQSLLCAIRRAMKAAGFPTLLTLPFPQIVYPSGWWSATLAAKTPRAFQVRQDHALYQTLNTQYYHFAWHEAALTPLPMLATLFEREGV